jgi:hypothetical protein
MVVLIVVLPMAAAMVLVLGGRGLRGAGIALLFATLVVYVVPVSPILHARVRRRNARD